MQNRFFSPHRNPALLCAALTFCFCATSRTAASVVAASGAANPTPASTRATKNARPAFAQHLGDVISLRDGTRVLAVGAKSGGASLHLFQGAQERVFTARRANNFQLSDFADTGGNTLSGATILQSLRAANNGFILRQSAKAARGLMGVSWSVRGIPLSSNIVVPGESGRRLTRDTPQSSFQFEYPLGWEAGFVIVEGKGGGFSVRSEETKPRFKRLMIKRDERGWTLTFVSLNQAPFANKTACESVPWRLETYRGSWRVAAKSYRNAMEKRLAPIRLEARKPAWAKDIRAVVIVSTDVKSLRVLATRFDPRQTMLYLPQWREDGYDRNYPEYGRVIPGFKAYIQAAQKMGFRVMLHVNYFGVDPLHPLFKKFEPYQMREPLGTHEPQWWWPARDMGMVNETIKFAYINPASRAWRALFVSRMKQLAREYSPDALHLDQTLVMTNDNNGLIDGMNSMEGNLALHRELRAAIPQVALSGEGLDEITAPHEAFAQRHVSGINFLTNGYDRETLATSHGISSYLLRPYTAIYGYLGMTPPASGQVYAAWQSAYQNWGVIPTLSAMGEVPTQNEGFQRQLFDEVKFFQSQKLDADVDGQWPENVAFPFRTKNGERAFYTDDGRLMWKAKSGDKIISQTVTSIETLKTRGTISGIGTYDASHIFGLDPARWYPLFSAPRGLNALHISQLPTGARADISMHGDIGVIALQASPWTVALTDSRVLAGAQNGFVPVGGGAAVIGKGALSASSGAQFMAFGDALFSHPAWQNISTDTKLAPDASAEKLRAGSSFLRFRVALPENGSLRFASEVAMGEGSVGEDKTDGATFRVLARAESGEKSPLSVQVFSDTTQRQMLTLDLTPFAGRAVILELQIDPGKTPTYDWARWYNPRIERFFAPGETRDVPLAVAGKLPWKLALSGTRASTREAGGAQNIAAQIPGAAYLLPEVPALVSMPLDFTAQPLRVSYQDSAGGFLPGSPIGAPSVHADTVGGVTRMCIDQHPPLQGRSVLLFPLTLPQNPVSFQSSVRLRDGSKSTGVVFRVLANGVEVASQRMLPGAWKDVKADLSRWAGKPVVIALVTDSDGPYDFDWALWGEPSVRETLPNETP